MKYIITISLLLSICYNTSAQSISNLSFGTDSTLEIMTWNIENFPKKGTSTVNYIKQVIEALDVDVIAFQEVADTVAFKNMMSNINGYSYRLGRYYYTSLAIIYKTDVIQANHIYEIYNSSAFYSTFPRSPLVINFDYGNERIFLIDNHFKCCGDGILDINDSDDEEYRRFEACNLLKEYVEGHFPDTKVVIVGDMNDELTDSQANNVFRNIIADSQNFRFTDMQIAQGNESNWSYPSWPSHLDHILITNELFSSFSNNGSTVEVIKVDNYIQGGWNTYDNYISDHRPVALKLHFSNSTNSIGYNSIDAQFALYPNPANSTINFKVSNECTKIALLNTLGQQIASIPIDSNATSATMQVEDVPNGLYFAVAMNDSNIIGIQKIVIKHR